ncbi:MAG: hypothetical protein IT381_28950 [Deltaproteobacteria bacterium]|nr:hypothetical protein [Deltaproteobacteria bacterium]
MSHQLKLPPLKELRRREPTTALGKWLYAGHQIDEADKHTYTSKWYWVLWLSGVDYFSTLGYQPGIALIAAGALSPIATAILVVVTLFGALPVYAEVAARSFAGQGSIAMLENLVGGWLGKILVLVLLGFAATDFIITMTLSAADAAVHAADNPLLHPYLGESHVLLTLGLLALLAAVFLRGFREAVGLASVVAIPYLVLNAVVLTAATVALIHDGGSFQAWSASVHHVGDWTGILIASALIFPKLALGMSGFETGVSVMPLIESSETDGKGVPVGRVRAARKLLGSAALVMSAYLVASSFISALLIPPAAYAAGGKANGRAIAYLAHEILGPTFGTVYDVSTIIILWFAGASAMTGLLSLIPRYLPRFGMAPQWITYPRPLVILLFLIDVVVTLIFHADVEAQGGAYATGVLVLILSAAVAVSIALWTEFRSGLGRKKLALCIYFVLVSCVFAFTLVDNVIVRPDGVIIASVFIGAIIILGALSRYTRATEMRISEFTFIDQESAILWLSTVGKTVNLVPLRTNSPQARREKGTEIRKYYSVQGPLAFVHVSMVDNRSEFVAPLQVRVREEEGNVVVEVFGAIAIANTIAYISELIDPISLFLGLTRQNLMTQALRYIFWGEGETGLMVYTILLRYWDSTPEDDVRPLIFLMSE